MSNGAFVILTHFFYQICLTPTMQEVNDFFGNIDSLLLDAISFIPRLSARFRLQPANSLIAYSKAIEMDDEFQRIQRKILDEMAKNQREMSAYIDQWAPLATIWQFDRLAFMRHFGAGDDTAAVHFAKNLNQFTDISNQIAIRETSLAVNFMAVNASQLRTNILAEIDDWQMKYLELLKTKTDEKIAKLFDYTEENGRRVAEVPKSVDDLHRCCSFYECLKRSIEHWKVVLVELIDYFEVLRRCKVISADEFSNMKANMIRQWNAYLDKLAGADEALDDAENRFKLML